MATETLYLASSVSGNAPSPQNALGAPNGTWAGTGNVNSNWTHRWRFTNPTESSLDASIQTMTLRVKKGTNSNSPTINGIAVISSTGADLYRDATLRSITSTTGVDIVIQFGADNVSSAGIEIEIITASAGGSPSARNGVDIDAVTWQASTKIGNAIPIANAGPDQSFITPGDLVTLTGIASDDPDGLIASYNWTQVGTSPAVVTLDGTGPTRTFTPTTSGTYTFSLTVTDNSGATSPADTMTVSVLDISVAPVADAGADVYTSKGSPVSRLGSATDANGGPLTYNWVLQTGPDSPPLTLSLENRQLDFTATAGGTYSLRFDAQDSTGLVGSDVFNVFVSDPTPPIVIRVDYTHINANINTQVENYAFVDNEINPTWSFNWLSGPSQPFVTYEIMADNEIYLYFTPEVAGEYVLQIVAQGVENSDTQDVSITVTDPTPPPASPWTVWEGGVEVPVTVSIWEGGVEVPGTGEATP